MSTEEQGVSGLGLEAQRTAIHDECRHRGWELVGIEEDVASGRSLSRPGLAAAQARIAAGDVDALVVAKLDRLSRSVHDFSGLLLRAEREGWGLRILDPDVDTVSPTGSLLAHITAAVAEWERRVIGQRTKAALDVKRAQGVRLGRPLELDAGITARILAAHRKGHPAAATARALDAEHVPTPRGGARWYPSTVLDAIHRAGGKVSLGRPRRSAASTRSTSRGTWPRASLPSRLDRAVCPQCARDVALRRGGELREHRALVSSPTLCSASGLVTTRSR